MNAASALRVLALEPFLGGSHRAFLHDWRAHSRHRWTVLGLPPRKWKWRMRHSALTLSEQVAAQNATWDLVFCSDMLNLAEFRALAPAAVSNLPTVIYFHENQFTYPVRVVQERDLHFGFTNATSALAADAVWFNSAYHRDSFLSGLRSALQKMPDYRWPGVEDRIRQRSRVEPLGVRLVTHAPRDAADREHLHVLWAARWEFDKGPEIFFNAVRLLREQLGLRRFARRVRVSVIGEQFAEQPDVFTSAYDEFCEVIERWGYQETRSAYEDALRDADVFVSTAEHEFFGVSAVEAISAGCRPLLPNRLVYPELLSVVDDPHSYLYDGDAASLAGALAKLVADHDAGHDTAVDATLTAAMQRFAWSVRGPQLDAQLAEVAAIHRDNTQNA